MIVYKYPLRCGLENKLTLHVGAVPVLVADYVWHVFKV